MKFAVALGLLTTLATPAAVQAASPPLITLKSTEELFGQLREMGYAPEPFDQGNTPSTVIQTREGKLAVILGGLQGRPELRLSGPQFELLRRHLAARAMGGRAQCRL